MNDVVAVDHSAIYNSFARALKPHLVDGAPALAASDKASEFLADYIPDAGAFAIWAQEQSLGPIHSALIADFLRSVGHAEAALRLASRAFAAHPRDLSVGGLIEACRDTLYGAKKQKKSKFCVLPFEHFEILPNGNVYLCCPGWLTQEIGNVNRSSWEDIWNSDAAKEIRASIHDGSFRFCNPNLCPPLSSNTLPTAESVKKKSQRWAEIVDEQITHVTEGPEVVSLSNDSTCNLSCPSCRTGMIKAKDDVKAQLRKTAEEVVLPLLKHAQRVSMLGAGDPFASQYARLILKKLTPSEYPNLRVSIQTNGVLFDERAWSDLELDGKIRNVIVSMDASTEDVYKVVRRGGDFKRLMENLQFLSRMRKAGKFDNLRLDCVVQWRNYRDLPGLIRIAEDLDADTVTFQAIYNWGTFSREDFLQETITRPDHPEFSDFLTVLRDPVMSWDRIYWGTIDRFRKLAISSQGV